MASLCGKPIFSCGDEPGIMPLWLSKSIGAAAACSSKLLTLKGTILAREILFLLKKK
jgi:hypothetical protein